MNETTRRPWADLAMTLTPIEGPYADFAAWEKWLFDETERHAPNEAALDAGTMDFDERIGLYVVMGLLADGEYSAEVDRLREMVVTLRGACEDFVRMDDARDEEITGGRWNAAVVGARCAIEESKGVTWPGSESRPGWDDPDDGGHSAA